MGRVRSVCAFVFFRGQNGPRHPVFADFILVFRLPRKKWFFLSSFSHENFNIGTEFCIFANASPKGRFTNCQVQRPPTSGTLLHRLGMAAGSPLGSLGSLDAWGMEKMYEHVQCASWGHSLDSCWKHLSCEKPCDPCALSFRCVKCFLQGSTLWWLSLLGYLNNIPPWTYPPALPRQLRVDSWPGADADDRHLVP